MDFKKETTLNALLVLAIVLVILCALVGRAFAATPMQDAAHQIAQQARNIGLEENDPIILRAKELWQAEWNKERDIIASVVYNEAWGGCTDRHRELVAAVVCNRIASDRWPDTAYDVVCQRGQYLPAYATPGSYYWNRASEDEETWETCRAIAEKAMRGEVVCPANVVFQANFTQGGGTYESCRTSYSTSYFCYQ